MAVFRNSTVLVSSDLFCTVWCYIDYVFNVVILMLICYGSIQRYLLVFHGHLVQRHVILFHYAPIVFCLVYPNLAYFGLIVLYPCVKQYDYTKVTCQGPCYLFERLPGSIDLLLHLTLPLSLCVLANLFLLIRVLLQKHRMKQQRKWKKNRHLVIQLLSIVIVHNLIWLPIIICLLHTLFAPAVDQVLIDLSVNLFTYSIYVVIMICPFVAMMGLPDVRLACQECIPKVLRLRRRRRTVHITTVPLQARSKTFPTAMERAGMQENHPR